MLGNLLVLELELETRNIKIPDQPCLTASHEVTVSIAGLSWERSNIRLFGWSILRWTVFLSDTSRGECVSEGRRMTERWMWGQGWWAGGGWRTRASLSILRRTQIIAERRLSGERKKNWGNHVTLWRAVVLEIRGKTSQSSGLQPVAGGGSMFWERMC